MNKAKIAKNEGFVRTEQSQSFHSDLNKASVFLHSRIKPKHSLKLNIDNGWDGSAWLSFDREAVHGWVSPGRQCMAGYQQGGSAWLGIDREGSAWLGINREAVHGWVSTGKAVHG